MVCNAQTTFKAVSATINDGTGTYTTSTFETTAMTVKDCNSYINVYWGGSFVNLQKRNSSTYSSSAYVNGQAISLTAYKPNGSVSYVKTKCTKGGQTVEITFKPAISSSSSISSTYGRTIDVSSNTIETSSHAWYATKVQVNSGSTIVTKVCRPKTAGTWIKSSGTEFIEDADTGTRYYIRSSSIGMSQKTILSTTSPKVFTETYPALPSHVKRINISSGSSYYVRGLKIR